MTVTVFSINHTKLNTDTNGVTYLKCDCTNEVEIKDTIELVIQKHGTINYLVNNVGWHPAHMPIDNMSADDFRQLFQLNVMSAFLFTKYALPHLRISKGR